MLATKVVAENGLSLDDNGIALGLASADAAGAMSAEMFSKVSNTIAGVLVGGVEATINEDKQVDIPVADDTHFGVVKASEIDNGVTVAVDGTMSVNRIGVSKLFVEADNILVLDCGNAKTEPSPRS